MSNGKKATYQLRFLFDYKCEGCLWANNKAAYEKYDVGTLDAEYYDLKKNPQEPKIKLPKEIRDKVLYLSRLFDSSLNWDSPTEPEPTWTNEKDDEFDTKSMELFLEISEYLGKDFELINRHDKKNPL